MKNFFDTKQYNKPIFETTNFVVIPSLGALVEGWLLIVPKNFHLNFSNIDITMMTELDQVFLHIGENILSAFNSKEYVVFEHGPSTYNSLAGCGVDYAHLHWVPTSFDLLNGIKSYLNIDFQWHLIPDIKSLTKFKNNVKDYLYLQDQKGNHLITHSDYIPSQTFRKVISHYINKPLDFDWKVNNQMHNILSTYEKIHQLAS